MLRGLMVYGQRLAPRQPTLLMGYGTLAYVYLTLTRRQMSGGGSKCPVTCWRWPLVDTEDGGHQHSFVLSPAVLSNRLLPAPSITHVHGSTAQLLPTALGYTTI